MNVYSLVPDSDNYQSLELVNEESDWEVIYKFNGKPLTGEWRPLPVRIMDAEDSEQLPPSDCPSLFTGAPVISQRAVEVLRPIIVGNGELLPLVCESDAYFVVNVTNIVDALDETTSEIVRFPDGKKVLDIKRFNFITSKLAAGVDIFKLPQRPLGGVFVTDQFVHAVRQAGLVGFDFEWLWASEQQFQSSPIYSTKLQ